MNMLNVVKKYMNLIPILYFSILLIISYIEYLSGNSVWNLKHYLAIILIVLNLLVFFTNRNYYKYVLLATIILGLFNFVIFTSATYLICNSLNGFKVCFQPQAFVAGFISYQLNNKKVNNFVLKGLGPERTKEQQLNYETELHNLKVKEYRNKFAGFSEEKLNKIVTERRHVAEAIEAANQLLLESKLDD